MYAWEEDHNKIVNFMTLTEKKWFGVYGYRKLWNILIKIYFFRLNK